MADIASISADAAQTLLARSTPPSPEETLKILRFLKQANDEVLGKLRQLKSEIGRAARH